MTRGLVAAMTPAEVEALGLSPAEIERSEGRAAFR